MFVKNLYASLKRDVEGTDAELVLWYSRGKAITDAIVQFKTSGGGCNILFTKPDAKNLSPVNVGKWTVTRIFSLFREPFKQTEIATWFQPLANLGLAVTTWHSSAVTIGAFNNEPAIKMLLHNARADFHFIMDALVCPETEAVRVAHAEELCDKHAEADLVVLLQHVAFRAVEDATIVKSSVWDRIRAQHQQWSGLRAVFVAACVASQ
jgi:hypothetical protein